MSLRPRSEALARVGRAGQRMAPGGRRWSESPVPRPGVRRPRQAGAAGVLPTAYTYDYNSDGTSATSVDCWPAGTPATGATVFCLMASEATLTPPTGWTLLDSGSAGALNWAVAGVNTFAGESQNWGMSWPGGSGEYAAWTFIFTGGSGITLAASGTENVDSASGTWVTPSSGWRMFVKFHLSYKCDYDTGTYGGVSGNYWYSSGWTNLWATWPINRDNASWATDPSVFLPGAVNDYDEVWTPTGAYACTTTGYSGTPQNVSVTVGLA